MCLSRQCIKILCGVLLTFQAAAQPQAFFEYHAHLNKAATEAGVPLGFIVGIIHTESRWNPYAKSPVGAVGLGQFMPATAEHIAKRNPTRLMPIALHDPKWQITAIALYVKELRDETKKMFAIECNVLGATASAYNGGLRWVKRRWEISGKSEDFWGKVRIINPGILSKNQQENQRYSAHVYVNQSKYPVQQFCTGAESS